MARTKQTVRPKDITAIKVAKAELFGPSTNNPSGQLTLVPIGPSEPSEWFSFRSCISAPKVDSDLDSEEEVRKGVPTFISEQSEMAKDSDLWPVPIDLQIENIGLHSEPVVSWCIDYYEKPRSKEGSEIVLRIVFEDNKGKEKTKDLGVVFYTKVYDNVFLEIWWENLRSKQLRKTNFAMALFDRGLLSMKGKGGLLDTWSGTIKEGKDYMDSIDDLRFKLLESKKSMSNVWWFLEQCKKYKLDCGSLGRVPQSVFFKRHTTPKFQFTKYITSKGLKLADHVESTEASTSSLHTGKQGSQTKSDKGPVPT
ncbi:hypothetical protein R1sor_011576 [Riccia sorocarpa]|uniref:Uncharacterized protein n=1 Tax=Riccia sorocarpa TaxID=122646 RepID=A0ABD3I193_9MARC